MSGLAEAVRDGSINTAKTLGLSDILEYQNNRPKQLGFVGEHNGPADAMRHILGSAQMTQKIGAIPTMLATTGYEGLGRLFGESGKEYDMDMANNQLGRSLAERFGSQQEIEDAAKFLMDYAAKYDLWNKQVPYVPNWMPKNQGDY